MPLLSSFFSVVILSFLNFLGGCKFKNKKIWQPHVLFGCIYTHPVTRKKKWNITHLPQCIFVTNLWGRDRVKNAYKQWTREWRLPTILLTHSHIASQNVTSWFFSVLGTFDVFCFLSIRWNIYSNQWKKIKQASCYGFILLYEQANFCTDIIGSFHAFKIYLYPEKTN